MPDILTETPAPVTDTAPPPALPGDESPLSAHIDAFHADKSDETTDGKSKHRTAYKDRASKQDVPRIRELTGKVKDAETRAESAAREAQEWRQKYEATTKPAQAPAPISQAAPVADTFTYPTFDEALAKNPALTYEDWTDERVEARLSWKAAKQQADTAKASQAQQQQDAQAAETAKYQKVVSDHGTRVMAYVQQHPERRAAFEAIPDTTGAPIFNAAIMQLDNSAEVLDRLLQNPDLFDDLVMSAEGKPFSETSVARMQRRLQKVGSAGITGAVPSPMTITPAPRPPTPVRTTPVPPTDDPPGDAGSLRDHAKAFHKGRR